MKDSPTVTIEVLTRERAKERGGDGHIALEIIDAGDVAILVADFAIVHTTYATVAHAAQTLHKHRDNPMLLPKVVTEVATAISALRSGRPFDRQGFCDDAVLLLAWATMQ